MYEAWGCTGLGESGEQKEISLIMWGMAREIAGAVGKDHSVQHPEDSGELLESFKLEGDVNCTLGTHYGYSINSVLEETKAQKGVGLEVIQGRNIGTLN